MTLCCHLVDIQYDVPALSPPPRLWVYGKILCRVRWRIDRVHTIFTLSARFCPLHLALQERPKVRVVTQPSEWTRVVAFQQGTLAVDIIGNSEIKQDQVWLIL